MNNNTQIENVVIINDVNEILTVSSLQIAEHFGKRHDHVLRDIQKIISSIYPKRGRCQSCKFGYALAVL